MSRAYLKTFEEFLFLLFEEDDDAVASRTSLDEDDVDGCNNLSSSIDFLVDLYRKEERDDEKNCRRE